MRSGNWTHWTREIASGWVVSPPRSQSKGLDGDLTWIDFGRVAILVQVVCLWNSYFRNKIVVVIQQVGENFWGQGGCLESFGENRIARVPNLLTVKSVRQLQSVKRTSVGHKTGCPILRHVEFGCIGTTRTQHCFVARR